MNAQDAFNLIREFNSMQQQIIDTEAARRRQMREELMELMQAQQAPEQGGGLEEELLGDFARMWMQKQAMQGGGSTTPAPAPVPVAPAAEVSPGFTTEHARVIAEDLRGRLPKTVLSGIENGTIDEQTALNYLSAWDLPERNARMIYDALVGGVK